MIISFEDTIASRLTMGTWHEGMGFKTVKVLTADGKIGYIICSCCLNSGNPFWSNI